MSGMDSNPHVDPLADAIIFSAEDAPLQNVEFLLDNLNRATKAVAYEQRTAALIAFLEHADGDEYAASYNQITTRLGLNERTAP